MKPHLLLILFAAAAVALAQNTKERETPLDNICGRPEDRKCIAGGIMNGRIVSVDALASPQKSQEKQVEGTVTVHVVFNENGDVIFAAPVSGPEELWAASIKAAVSTRINPTKLSGKPIRVSGVLNIKNGRITLPGPTRGIPVIISP